MIKNLLMKFFTTKKCLSRQEVFSEAMVKDLFDSHFCAPVEKLIEVQEKIRSMKTISVIGLGLIGGFVCFSVKKD